MEANIANHRRIDISLIMCFRERMDFFRDMIKTLLETVHNPTRLELLIAMDDDDQATIAMVKEMIPALPFTVKIFEYVRSDYLIKTHLNPTAKHAVGTWFLGIADDTRFITKDWDKIIFERMNDEAFAQGDAFLLGLPSDGLEHNGLDFSCWPVTSKEAHDAFGYWYNEFFFFWGADHFVSKIYTVVGRVVDLRDVMLNHYTYHNGQRPMDKNGQRFNRLASIIGAGSPDGLVEKEASKLTSMITQGA